MSDSSAPSPKPADTTPSEDSQTARRPSMSRDAMLVGVGLLATTIFGALQALVLVLIADVGEQTDGFLAAYTVYSGIAIVGISMRRSLVPLLLDGTARFPERACELLSRVALLGLAAGVLIVVLALPISVLLTHGLSTTARDTAFTTLLVLAPAGALQILSGAASAALSAMRRLPFSVGLYAGSSLIAVATSALLLVAFGIIGAAIGVAAGALCTAAGHVTYLRRSGVRLRMRPAWACDREQRRLVLTQLSAGVLGASQQLTLAVALSAVAINPGDVTTYSFAYLLVMVLLNVTSAAVSLVAVPSLVEAVAARGRRALEDQFLRLAPYVFAVLVPLLATLALFGRPFVDLVFGAVMSDGHAAQIFHLTTILALAGIPASVFVLCISLILAVRENTKAATTAIASVLIHVVVLSAVAQEGPTVVAFGHVGAASVSALLISFAVFGRSTPRVVARLACRIAPAFGLGMVFPIAAVALGTTAPSLAQAGVAIVVAVVTYAALAALVWKPVARPFLRPLQSLVARCAAR